MVRATSGRRCERNPLFDLELYHSKVRGYNLNKETLECMAGRGRGSGSLQEQRAGLSIKGMGWKYEKEMLAAKLRASKPRREVKSLKYRQIEREIKYLNVLVGRGNG